jgi:hypothetical protein
VTLRVKLKADEEGDLFTVKDENGGELVLTTRDRDEVAALLGSRGFDRPERLVDAVLQWGELLVHPELL